MLNKGLAGASPKEKQNLKSNIENIGQAIQLKRISSKLTQEGVAEALDINVNTIKFIEQGRRIPSLGMLIRILDHLGLEVAIFDKKSGRRVQY